MMRRPGLRHSNGFSLLELSMALAIFSTGIGAFSLLLLMSVRETASCHAHTVAVSQARSLSNQYRLLPAIADFTSIGEGSASCLTGASCAPASMAGATVTNWRLELSNTLPGGDGVLCMDSTPHDGMAGSNGCDGLGNRVVKVFWQEPGSRSGDSPEPRRVVVQAGKP